jgi:two-component system probable response regulator PhcQ
MLASPGVVINFFLKKRRLGDDRRSERASDARNAPVLSPHTEVLPGPRRHDMANSTGIPDYKGYPILYIDDEVENLEAFRDEFEEYFTIYTASTGAEGIRILTRERIALVLADQRMPVMTGVEVLEHAQKIDPRILRILITAYADIEVVIDSINKGNVYRYFKKPWEHEDIRTGLMRGIEHYHNERERERLQAEKIENMKKMVRSNRLAAVGTMVSGLVHEIRNPMVAIQSFLQLLPRKMGDKEFLMRYARIAQGEADRIEKLLENMLSFARPARPVLRLCDMNELVDRTIQLLDFQARRTNIRIAFEKDASLPMVYTDPNQMAQVLQNLGINAIQAMERSGELTFRSFLAPGTGKGARVALEIRDTGPGIPDEHLEKIFDPFFTTKDEGTGLGLSISYQIVTEHNGLLEVDSRPGQGTTFTIYLPVAEALGRKPGDFDGSGHPKCGAP